MTTYRISNLADELHVGDIGTELIVTIYDITETDGELDQDTPLNLTGLTVTMLLAYEDQIIEKTTEVVGLAAAGTVKAVTEDGDLVAGRLTIRCLVEIAGGTSKWYTSAVSTRVYPIETIDA
jgi:hypothetical protein